MKDIRFWRAEYPEDIIGCDQTNRGSKIDALIVVGDETLLKAELYLLYFILFFWEDDICATKPFLGTNETWVCVEAGLHACVRLTGGFPVCLWGVHMPQVLVLLLQWWTPCSLGDSPPLQSADAHPGECSEKGEKQTNKKNVNEGCYIFCLLWCKRKHFPRSCYTEKTLSDSLGCRLPPLYSRHLLR